MKKTIKQVLPKEEFFCDIFSNEYILILGGGIMLDRKYGDLNSYILHKIWEDHDISVEKKEEAKLEAKLEGIQSFNTIDRIEKHYLLTEKPNLFSSDKLCKELVNFLKVAPFKVVFTTTVDSFAQRLMDEVWGKGKYKTVVFHPEMPILFNEFVNDIIMTLDKEGANYNQPTLVYVFGKAEDDYTKSFLSNDDDAIFFIEEWIKVMNGKPELCSFIRSKKILALGCKFDDWYFRFFWYIMNGKTKDAVDKGVVSFGNIDNSNRSDTKLRYFLLSNTRMHSLEDPYERLAFYTKMLEDSENSEISNIIKGQLRMGQIFISYGEENKNEARELFYKLRKHGYNVWFDRTRLPGKDFNVEIPAAIQKSKVVILLLSDSTANDLANDNYKERYYVKEWQLAMQGEDKKNNKSNRVIIPLAINLFDFRDKTNSKILKRYLGRISGINYWEPGCFQQLLDTINNALKQR